MTKKRREQPTAHPACPFPTRAQIFKSCSKLGSTHSARLGVATSNTRMMRTAPKGTPAASAIACCTRVVFSVLAWMLAPVMVVVDCMMGATQFVDVRYTAYNKTPDTNRRKGWECWGLGGGGGQVEWIKGGGG